MRISRNCKEISKNSAKSAAIGGGFGLVCATCYFVTNLIAKNDPIDQAAIVASTCVLAIAAIGAIGGAVEQAYKNYKSNKQYPSLFTGAPQLVIQAEPVQATSRPSMQAFNIQQG